MLETAEFTIRKMVRLEFDLAMDWAVQEGLNPARQDGDCIFDTDPDGFFVALNEDVPVGCISAAAYDHTFGFISFHMVRSDFRSLGLGRKLWNAATEYLGDKIVGLDSLTEYQGFYEEVGFRLAYKNVRFQGKGLIWKFYPGIVELKDIPFSDVQDYDDDVFPVARPRFLQNWIRQPTSNALGIMHNGRLAGYGVIRKCRDGCKVGPLFADNPDLADTMFQALLSQAGEETAIFMDVPKTNLYAMELAERYDMMETFEIGRMYNVPEPKFPLYRIYGVTSLELG